MVTLSSQQPTVPPLLEPPLQTGFMEEVATMQPAVRKSRSKCHYRCVKAAAAQPSDGASALLAAVFVSLRQMSSYKRAKHPRQMPQASDCLVRKGLQSTAPNRTGQLKWAKRHEHPRKGCQAAGAQPRSRTRGVWDWHRCLDPLASAAHLTDQNQRTWACTLTKRTYAPGLSVRWAKPSRTAGSHKRTADLPQAPSDSPYASKLLQTPEFRFN